MLDDLTNLSPDLEWMLQTNQVSAAVVVDSLAREYYPRIYHIAYVLLGRVELARMAADQTILDLISNRSRFPAGFTVRLWVMHTILHSCRALNRQRLTQALFAHLPRQVRASHMATVDSSTQDTLDAGRLAYSQPAGRLVDQEVRAAMSTCSMADRFILALSCIERMTVTEIAQVTGALPETVRYRIRQLNDRLLRRLRQRICELGACGSSEKTAWFDLSHLRYQTLIRDHQDGHLEQAMQEELDRHLSRCSICSGYANQLELLARLLTHALESWQPWGYLQNLVEDANTRILEKLETNKKRLITQRKLQQVLIGSAILSLVAVAGWMGNAMNLAAPPSPTVVHTVIVTEIVRRQVYITPTPIVLPPLTVNSSAREVLVRMIAGTGTWRSLWLEGWIVNYGPVGYAGPPLIYRNQMWVEHPGWDSHRYQALVLSSFGEGEPQYASVAAPDSLYQMDLKSGLSFYYKTGQDPVQFQGTDVSPSQSVLVIDGATSALDGSAMRRMIFPADLLNEERTQSLKLLGEETVANRQAIIVETLARDGHRNLLWLESATGHILRWQAYAAEDPNLLISEMLITGLVYDAPFPDLPASNLFLWLENFSWKNIWIPFPNATRASLPEELSPGRQLGLSIEPAHPEYDPSQEILTFSWPATTTITNSHTTAADVYAGNYYLGSAVLGNPWTLSCERSPNGEYLIVSDQPDQYPFTTMPLTWLRLGPPLEAHEPLPAGSYAGTDMEFSPDGHSLAYYGCGGSDMNCGIYITDLQTQKNQKLMVINLANWFVWSPDGRYLAFYASDAANTPSLFVVDVDSGSVVHKSRMDWKKAGDTWEIVIPEDSPVKDWGISYPPLQQGLGGCVNPP